MTQPNAKSPRPVSTKKVILVVSVTIMMLVVAGIMDSNKSRSSDITSGADISTSNYRAAAQQLVKQHLRDPSSAEFSDIRVIPAGGDKPTIVCGKVNAKNGFGGMNGAKRFVVGGTVAVEEEVGEADMNKLWATFC